MVNMVFFIVLSVYFVFRLILRSLGLFASGSCPSSSHHHFLNFDIVATHEANHINASGGVDAGLGAAFDLLAAEDASIEVNYL